LMPADAPTLDLDVGNSRIKWRYRESRDGAVPRPRQAALAADTLEALAALLPEVPQRVCVANVRGAAFESRLREWCWRHYRVEVEVARVAAQCAGLRNAYQDPSQMGVDRWLAMLAAFTRVHGACCVVDSGSALTIDAVAANGQHLGGYILPGLRLQRSAITEHTAIRLPALAQWQSIDPGHSTLDAVEAGILLSLVTLLANAPEVRQASEQDALFLAGGDAATLAPWLRQRGLRWHNAPDLVLDGLACMLP